MKLAGIILLIIAVALFIYIKKPDIPASTSKMPISYSKNRKKWLFWYWITVLSISFLVLMPSLLEVFK